MSRPKDYERALQLEEKNDYSAKVRGFEDDDFIEGQDKRVARLERALRNDILSNPQFVGCVFMFLEWLQHNEIADLEPVVDKAGDGTTKVFSIQELAGMTAASLLEKFFKNQNISYDTENSKGKIVPDKEIQSWMIQRLTEVTKEETDESVHLSYFEAQIILQGLTTYMDMFKTEPQIFTRILPVQEFSKPSRDDVTEAAI